MKRCPTPLSLFLLPILFFSGCEDKPPEEDSEQDEMVRVIRAERLEIVDKEGVPRIVLYTDEVKNSIEMISQKDGSRILINNFQNGQNAILIQNKFGINRIGLSTKADGDPTISLYGSGDLNFLDEKAAKILSFSEDNSVMTIKSRAPGCGGKTFLELKIDPEEGLIQGMPGTVESQPESN